jgi:GWxTD domain-containing protein
MKQFFLAVVLILISQNLHAQTPYKEIVERKFADIAYPQTMPAMFRLYPVANSQQKFTVYLICQVQYDFLQFVLSEQTYQAAIEIEILFQVKNNPNTPSKLWRSKIIAADFMQTQSPHLLHTTIDSLQLPPASYTVHIKYRDLNGERQLRFVQKLNLESPRQGYLAAPLFFYPDSASSQIKIIDVYPSALHGYWHFNRTAGVLLQAYLPSDHYLKSTKAILIDAETGKTLQSRLWRDTTATTRHFMARWIIPGNLLDEGKYRLQIQYYTNRDSLRKILPFEVVWFDKPKSLWHPELMLQPLKYIVDEATFQELSHGDFEAHKKKIKAFWKQQDPTPETPYNELMAEFYSRVDTAMVRFSTRRSPGWQTDTGKIWILMGRPTEIDDHSLDPIPTPYMRWIYRFDDKELVYTFRAVEGRKEYELTESIEKNL